MKNYMIDSPVLKSAEQFKNIVVEAESIKFKLESKEEEIREIKKIKKAPSAKDYCGGRARRNILISCNTLASIWRNQANRIFQINCISNL